MRTRWTCAAGAALTLIALGGAGTEGRAQYARRTPIVEAVQKTRASIVTIKVEKKGNWGRKEVVGTGVVVDERGYVVTNRHVVAGADRITILATDSAEILAQVHVEDARYDLAILKMPGGRRLPELAFGPSSDLMVGETVIAVGHPFGYTNTVSTGIVSALGREITMPSGETLTNLIQTNASINPGNSGGPLLNINGELVGINVALREGAQGIAFALPAEAVQRVLSQHLSAAKIAKVSHGLAIGEMAREEGQVRQQVIVEKLKDAGPAARAGLQRGDILRHVGDRSVSNRFDVERALWGMHAGEKVELRVVRDGQELKAILTLARSAEADLVSTANAASGRPSGGAPDKAQPAKGPR